jgi:hypothetical protein
VSEVLLFKYNRLDQQIQLLYRFFYRLDFSLKLGISDKQAAKNTSCSLGTHGDSHAKLMCIQVEEDSFSKIINQCIQILILRGCLVWFLAVAFAHKSTKANQRPLAGPIAFAKASFHVVHFL